MNLLLPKQFLNRLHHCGKHLMQGSFPRLKDKMLFSESMADQKAFLYMITYLIFEQDKWD